MSSYFRPVAEHNRFYDLVRVLECVSLPPGSEPLTLDRDTLDRVFEPVEGGPTADEAWDILTK